MTNKLIQEVRAASSQPARQTDRGWERDYLFSPSFLGVQGHFPGQPVLPAIVQIMIFRESIIQQLNCELEIIQINRAKFLKVTGPDMPLTAVWKIKNTGNAYSCECLLNRRPAGKQFYPTLATTELTHA
jgi:hypothetical protein